MAKFVNHSGQKGFLSMSKKATGLGVKKPMLMEGSKKFKLMEKRTQFKAK